MTFRAVATLGLALACSLAAPAGAEVRKYVVMAGGEQVGHLTADVQGRQELGREDRVHPDRLGDLIAQVTARTRSRGQARTRASRLYSAGSGTLVSSVKSAGSGARVALQ